MMMVMCVCGVGGSGQKVGGAIQFIEACSVWQNRLAVPPPFCVQVRPPSLDDLRQRLSHRDSETLVTHAMSTSR